MLTRRSLLKGLLVAVGASTMPVQAALASPPRTFTPTVVYEARDHLRVRNDRVAEWCAAHGVDANDTYRVEIDAVLMQARIYQYDRDPQGRHYLDRGDVATREPFIVKVSYLPGGTS